MSEAEHKADPEETGADAANGSAAAARGPRDADREARPGDKSVKVVARKSAQETVATAEEAPPSGAKASGKTAGGKGLGNKGAENKGSAAPKAGQGKAGQGRAAGSKPSLRDATPPRPGVPVGASDIFATVPFALKRHVSPHGQVTAVSMMKDEGPFVLEWVAHHLAVGFTDLVVYTNDCSDGTDDMLIRLEELGLAHHRRNVIPEGLRPQPSALNHAQDEPVVGSSDWVLVFDADEFLSIRYGNGTLDDLIGAATEMGANGIVITWRIFGSGNVIDWSRAPVTEQYLMAAPQDWNKGWGVKTLFKFDPDFWKLGIHRPKIKTKHLKTSFPDEVKWINGSGREMPEYFKFRGWRSIIRTVGYDWGQMNHYAVKSVDSYALRKLRGNVNNKKDKYNSDYWSLQDRNEIRDETMLRYSEKRNEIMEILLSDPVLNRLHFAAVDRAEARLDEIRQTPAYAELLSGLTAASKVSIKDVSATPPQARDPARIQAMMSEVEKQRTSAAQAKRRTSPTPAPDKIFSIYNDGESGISPKFSGEWVTNYGIELPLDPGLFSYNGQRIISKGKFDRGLIRRVPLVLENGLKVLEIGSGIGFLMSYLARSRPDLDLTLREDDPGLQAALRMIAARNGVTESEKLRFDLARDKTPDALPAYIADQAPDALLLADGRIGPSLLSRILATCHPARVILHGRLLEQNRDRIDEVIAIMSPDYRPEDGFEANLTLSWIAKKTGDSD